MLKSGVLKVYLYKTLRSEITYDGLLDTEDQSGSLTSAAWKSRLHAHQPPYQGLCFDIWTGSRLGVLLYQTSVE